MYGLESCFYPHMNKYLSNGKIGIYKGFIDILNYGVQEGILNSYKGEIFYRGGRISKKEF